MWSTGPTRPSRPDRFSGRAGLTLLELIIVMAVMSVMLGLALPRLTGANPAGDLRTAGRRLAGVINLARSQAVTTASPIEVTIFDAGRMIRIENSEKVIKRTRLPGQATAVGLRVRGVSSGEKIAKLIFRPDGRTTEAAVYLVAGDNRLTLHLLPLTGRLEARPGFVIYDWAG